MKNVWAGFSKTPSASPPLPSSPLRLGCLIGLPRICHLALASCLLLLKGHLGNGAKQIRLRLKKRKLRKSPPPLQPGVSTRRLYLLLCFGDIYFLKLSVNGCSGRGFPLKAEVSSLSLASRLCPTVPCLQCSLAVALQATISRPPFYLGSTRIPSPRSPNRKVVVTVSSTIDSLGVSAGDL